MDAGGTGYGLVTIIGGFLLLVVIIAATIWSRRGGNTARSEQATRDLYKEIDRDEKRGERR